MESCEEGGIWKSSSSSSTVFDIRFRRGKRERERVLNHSEYRLQIKRKSEDDDVPASKRQISRILSFVLIF